MQDNGHPDRRGESAGRGNEVDEVDKSRQTIISGASPIKPKTICGDLLRLSPHLFAKTAHLRNWVCWKWGLRDGKWTKVPKIGTAPSINAKSNTSGTWRTYDQSVESYRKGEADGIGLMLALETDIVAIDIDKCRNAETGVIHPWASTLVQRANSYTEITPSGTGLRVLGTGSERKLHTKIAVLDTPVSVELYRHCERYVTVSNLPLDGVTLDINDIDALLDALAVELKPTPPPPKQKLSKPESDIASSLEYTAADAYSEASLPNDLRTLIRDGAQVGDRSEDFYHAVRWLKDLSWQAADITSLLARYPNGIAEKYIDRLDAEVQRAYDKPPGAAAAGGLDFNDPPKPQDNKPADNNTPKPLIVSSADFLKGFVPPNYLIDGLLQRGFIYSLTGDTGHGKTAIALLIAAHVALGTALGEHEVEQGRVLFLAGENPDDIRMRWMAMADTMKFDLDKIEVHFLPGVFKLSVIGPRIIAEVEKIGPVALVVIDTSAAYFEGDDDNQNVQAGTHARRMRYILRQLPGLPTGLICAHPVKRAEKDNLIPRGGGAFLAEVDGNLSCWKVDSLATVHWQGKFRGPDFAPMPFLIQTVTTTGLKDSKGRLIPSVIAKTLSDEERATAAADARSDEDKILIKLAEVDGRMSLTALAERLYWTTKDGKPNKSRVRHTADRLKKDKMVTAERDGLMLTAKGKKEVRGSGP
jgi:hypothetical protein